MAENVRTLVFRLLDSFEKHISAQPPPPLSRYNIIASLLSFVTKGWLGNLQGSSDLHIPGLCKAVTAVLETKDEMLVQLNVWC